MGHPTAIRTVQVSSDDSLILTSSSECVKIWNSENREIKNVVTVSTRYVTSSAFLSKNNYFLIGDKEGYLG